MQHQVIGGGVNEGAGGGTERQYRRNGGYAGTMTHDEAKTDSEAIKKARQHGSI